MRIRNRRTEPPPILATSVPITSVVADATDGREVDAFLRPGFLTAAECLALRAEMDEASRVEGGVREAERPGADTVDLADATPSSASSRPTRPARSKTGSVDSPPS